VWLKGNLTPQEVRDLILDPSSNFQKHIISWVESCQMGEFMTGTKEEVLHKVSKESKMQGYKDPTETMPEPPPPFCSQKHQNASACKKCMRLNAWWQRYEETVDDLLSKPNIHNCDRGANKDGSRNKRLLFVGCKDNKYGTCKARFPRTTHEKTEIDPDTGSINLKKLEPWINTFTPLLTYLARSNADVTCMWSGTAMKAVIVYISDYITKSGLKTHVIFEAIKSIFDK
ncbi:hypothetical protein M378DRAFT_48224, partial [Amanita muscaria Koide BX008]